MKHTYELYENTQGRSDKYWACRRVNSNEIITRWGPRAGNKLINSKQSSKSLDVIKSKKLSDGYVYVGKIHLDELSGTFSFETQASPDFNSKKLDGIVWEFQPPFPVTDDVFSGEFMDWCNSTLIPNLEDANVAFSVLSDPPGIQFDDWSLTLGKDADFDVTRNRSGGLISKENGYLAVFFLLSIKSIFKDDQWKDALYIGYEDDTEVGLDIKNEQKFLEYFGIQDIDSIRDAAVAFGLMAKRIKFEIKTNVDASATADWF